MISLTLKPQRVRSQRHPLLQRVMTLLAALLLALLLLGSMLILPGLVQPVRMAVALQ